MGGPVPAESDAARDVVLDAVLDSTAGLHKKALVEHNLGHPLAALRLLRRALRELQAVPDAARSPRGEALGAAIWISLALNEAEVHGVERGLVALAEAQRRADLVGDPALQVRCIRTHAQIATRAGQLDLAVEQFEAAAAMLEHADSGDHFGVLLNSANVRLFRGELAEARRLLTAAASFAQTQHMHVGRFMALHNLGYVQFLAGNLPQALSAMDSAAQLDVDISRGVALLDRARVLVESGLAREADDVLAQATVIFARDRLAQDLGEAEVSRAECALLAGDIGAARRFAARARDRFRRRGNDRWRRTAELVLLQGDLAAARPGSRLAPVALRLEAELRADGLKTRAITAALVAAEALLDAGDVPQAVATVDDGARSTGSAPVAVRLHSRFVRARLALAAGAPADAQRQARLGLHELAAYQASFGGIDLRTASAIHGRRLAELDLAVAVETGRPGAVFAAVERGRAVSSRLAPVSPPADPESADLLAELRQVVEAIRGESGDDTRLQARRRDLERAIKARSWTLTGGGAVQRPATFAEIRGGTDATGGCVIAFVRVGAQLHAAVTGHGRARLHELALAEDADDLIRRVRADLDVLAYDTLPAGLRNAANASLTRSLDGLDRMLLRPLGVDGQRQVVIPTGILAALPWTLLPSLREVPVVVSPSASAWLAGQRDARTAGPVSTVALAGPDLERAEAEAGAIGSIRAGSSVLVGELATRDALSAAMSAAGIVHVAAHGQHQTGNPLFSSLRLADGPLFAHELDKTAPHVVLSACELGLATVRTGDEALGLTSVLLHLGTRSVVSGVARVSDRAAAEAMVGYHRLLAEGSDTASALAGAVAHSDQPLPFVCFGNEWRLP